MRREQRRRELMKNLSKYLEKLEKKFKKMNFQEDLEQQLRDCFTIVLEIHNHKLLENLEEEKDRVYITWISKFDTFNDELYHILHFEHVNEIKIKFFQQEFQKLFSSFQEHKEEFITKK